MRFEETLALTPARRGGSTHSTSGTFRARWCGIASSRLTSVDAMFWGRAILSSHLIPALLLTGLAASPPPGPAAPAPAPVPRPEAQRHSARAGTTNTRYVALGRGREGVVFFRGGGDNSGFGH